MTAQQPETVPTHPTKADVIARVTEAWPTLVAAIGGADEAALTAIGPDGWSVKDHLAHLEGWERYLLALLERRSPSQAIGVDLATLCATADDPLNELLIAPTKAHPLARVLAELRHTHERLLAVVAALPEGDLDRRAADYQPDELADDPDSIAGWITHICDEHLREHVGWIQRLLARG